MNKWMVLDELLYAAGLFGISRALYLGCECNYYTQEICARAFDEITKAGIERTPEQTFHHAIVLAARALDGEP